ncbi:stress protein [Lysinibacillus fusiformis]|uniref:stress protein n=1 Tax=Lysinibacillus fusiformis TaxID=28031 RepID=UPI0036ED7146
MAACGSNSKEASVTTNDVVIQSFKDDGLDIGDVSDLENKEFGDTRKEGKRILVPSLGEDAGGRLFMFKDKKGLEKAKSYYDELGKESPLLYSHTHANGLFLIQMNSDMKDAEFEKFKNKNSMDKALK